MSWLRIDDGFTANAKIAQLTDREFRVFFRLLCHCGKSKDPSVDPAAIKEVPGLTPRLISKLEDIRLLDEIGDQHEIHNWLQYQPKDSTNADRQARWRARRRNASRNGQVTVQTVTPTVTQPLPRARARADSRPDPSLKTSNPVTATEDNAREPDDGTGPGESELDKINKLLAQAAAQDMPE
jgi:hypothetical protein